MAGEGGLGPPVFRPPSLLQQHCPGGDTPGAGGTRGRYSVLWACSFQPARAVGAHSHGPFPPQKKKPFLNAP